MSDEITVEGKQYVSSKRASDISHYAQDYIGQLARGGLIEARRIGGLWYVSMDSLEVYKVNAESFKPQPPRIVERSETDSFVTLDGREYVSASRASDITRYNQDYVGQLARSGKILAKQVGNRWYIDRLALVAHKEEKDALLAAVQAQSVGIRMGSPIQEAPSLKNLEDEAIFYSYTHDEGDFLPLMKTPQRTDESVSEESSPDDLEDSAPIAIPIRVISRPKIFDHRERVSHVESTVRIPRKTMFYGTLMAAALTVVAILSFGLYSLKGQSLYVGSTPQESRNAGQIFTASASALIGSIGDMLEKVFSPELIYKRLH